MKKWGKYIILFVILVLIGGISVQLYHSNSLENTDNSSNEKVKNDSKNIDEDIKIEKEENTSKEHSEISNTSTENTGSSSKNNVSNNNTVTSSDNITSSIKNDSSTSSNSNTSQGLGEEYIIVEIDISTSSNDKTISSSGNSVQNNDVSSSSNLKHSTVNEENIIEVKEDTNSNVQTNSKASSTSNNNSSSNKTTSSSNVLEIDLSTESTSDISSSNSVSSTSGSNKSSASSTSSSNKSSASSTSSSNKNSTSSTSSSNKSSTSSTSSSNKNSTSSTSSSNKDTVNNVIEDGELVGSTGYGAFSSGLYLKEKMSSSSKNIVEIKAGIPFKILGKNSSDTWWKVSYKGKTGYVQTSYCMINLPDYIPSITYNITNASASIYQSSGVSMSVTGKQLYKTSKVYNERLEREEYIVPVVYSFAKKILTAQSSALKEGYSLKIYDAYRPKSVANEVRDSLLLLYNNNKTVRSNINYSSNGSYWGQSWFIAQNLSAHSLASAIDVTLTKKGSTEDLKMPSAMHELSTKSIKYRYGVNGQTTVRTDLYVNTMTTDAKRLDKIMVNAGLTTLASEWWHFQDNEAYKRMKSYEPNGLDVQPTKIVSSK